MESKVRKNFMVWRRDIEDIAAMARSIGAGSNLSAGLCAIIEDWRKIRAAAVEKNNERPREILEES